MSELSAIAPAQPSAIGLIQQAMTSGVSPEHLRELLAVRREWESDEARKAFNLAISEFQRRAPIVEKGDKGEKADYASLDRIWRTIRPLLTELGLAVTWLVIEIKGEGESAFCHLDGILSHKAGHRERLAFDLPMPGIIKTRDGRAVTNPAQMMGSAVSYAKRYAICAALGVVTGEDDDAHGAATVFISKELQQSVMTKLDACRGLADFEEAKFWKWLNIEAGRFDLIPLDRLNDVLGSLERKLKGGSK